MIRRPVKRETLGTVFDGGKNRSVIVGIEPIAGVVTFRLKGTRRLYQLPASYLYMEACWRHVSLEKARKAKEKKARRAMRRG